MVGLRKSPTLRQKKPTVSKIRLEISPKPEFLAFIAFWNIFIDQLVIEKKPISLQKCPSHLTLLLASWADWQYSQPQNMSEVEEQGRATALPPPKKAEKYFDTQPSLDECHPAFSKNFPTQPFSKFDRVTILYQKGILVENYWHCYEITHLNLNQKKFICYFTACYHMLLEYLFTKPSFEWPAQSKKNLPWDDKYTLHMCTFSTEQFLLTWHKNYLL